ncbi:MAG: hypothetical protein M0027_10310 [Candidatus Dormibacteraeota bacterium]|nr:hypothetical protein [Candidatus Dormibacteraeota bacterium]
MPKFRAQTVVVGVRRSTPPSGPPVISVILIGLGVGAGALALLALHLLPTGLSPVRNPVSQYGIPRIARATGSRPSPMRWLVSAPPLAWRRSPAPA